MLIKHWRALRTRLPADQIKRGDPYRDAPVITIGNIIALALVIAILLGIVPALLPGAAHDPVLQPPAVASEQWQIRQEYNCVVDMPHGKRRCAMGTIRGAVVVSEAY